MYNVTDLKNIPELPGVYIMYDNIGNILYIGKAKNLKNRIPVYFKEIKNRNPLIEKMATLIHEFDYIVTNNELEALILENNLIKEKNPKYNTLLRDDKGYPYIEISIKDDFPYIKISNQKIDKNSLYFGPYTDKNAAKEIVELIKKIFDVRICEYKTLPKKECLYYQLKKCNGPCIGKVSKETYSLEINKIKKFLGGDTKLFIKEYSDKMIKASELLDFEAAAKYRDIINNIKAITTKQLLENKDEKSKDIISLYRNNDNAILYVFHVKDGKVVGNKNYKYENIEYMTDSDIIKSFIMSYYNENNIPKNIYIKELEDIDIIKEYLISICNIDISLNIPIKGDNYKLIKLAENNAKIIYERTFKENKKDYSDLIKKLEKLINIKDINRIESYDISNTSGVLQVASMIVIDKTGFNKKSYRKYKLEHIGQDDLACMKEVINRRFSKEKEEIPDLLLIDGGENQVNVIKEELKKLSIDINVCGMVKDNKHKTNHLYFNEKDIEIKDKELFNFISLIQEEVHRFAINYHDSLRNKEMKKSILDNIEGIGPKKKISILTNIKDIDLLKNMTVEELCKIDKIDKKTANNIYDYFHPDI